MLGSIAYMNALAHTPDVKEMYTYIRLSWVYLVR